jgi:hypothetical protein
MADSGRRSATAEARGRLAVAVAVAGIVAATVPALAGAAPAKRPLEVEIRGSSLGKVWDRGKVPVRVETRRPGRAKLEVRALTDDGAARITKTSRARLAGGVQTVAAKLTKRGKAILLDCTTEALEARVAFESRSGKRRRTSARSDVDNDLGPCSRGSENPVSRRYHGPPIPTPNAARCDFLETSVCLYPFPNDYFTAEDAATETGRRLALDPASMPKTFAGDVPFDPTDLNRADGFGPGQPIGLKVPGLTTQAAFDANALVPVSDLAAYDDPDQRVVVVDAETGERHPVFAELDANAELDRDRALYIRPAVNFEEGRRYIVALRGLENAAGERLEPGLAFRAYRDRLRTGKGAIEDRRAHMEDLFSTLQEAGIQRRNLYLAWDFTVASAESIAGRALAIRDDAFERLGDTNLEDLAVQGDSPAFTIDPITPEAGTSGIVEFEPCSAGANPDECEEGEDDELLRLVRGKVTTPCYLDEDGCPPGAQFAYDGADDLMPNFDPEFDVSVPFTCVIPRSVVDGGEVDPARPSLYGHGLLGSRSEVERGSGGNIRTMANDHNFVFCATDWAGFSNQDLGTIAASLTDMSNFPKVADRVLQGFVNFMYLGRAMIHADGLGSDPAFRVDPDGGGGAPSESVIDGARLFYDGNSQGGIMGGALTALAPDFERAVLGVPAMNYSTLLQRSVDFAPYAPILYGTYPNELERPLLFSLVQMLWDRAEANGYAQHMTDQPYENTPEHQVLLHVAFGDHQVANLAAEVEARTIGASTVQPALDPGRHWDANPLWGIPAIQSYPFDGSAIVYWDGGPAGFDGTIGFGTSGPPNANVPPAEVPGSNEDPHSYPRRDAQARQQKSEFLAVGGSIASPCGDPVELAPCYANGYPGP